MQYARNIASGNGFSFNPGEPSYGITSPLWVTIVSLGYLINLDGFWFAKILDLLFSLCSVYMMYRLSMLLFRNDTYFSFLASSLLLLNIWFVRWSFTGMETNLSVFLLLSVFYFYFKVNYDLTFFLLGMLCLVRPEGFTLFLVVLLSLFFTPEFPLRTEQSMIGTHRRRPPLSILRHLAIFLCVVLPFIVFAKANFGTFVPNTVLGKATLTLSFDTLKAQLIEIAKTLAPSSSMEILLSIFFLFQCIRKKEFRAFLPLWLWPLTLLLMYILTDSDIISRYLLLVIPVFTIFALKAIQETNSGEPPSHAAIKQTGKLSRGHALGVILFLLLAVQSQFVFYYYVRPHVRQFTQGLNDCLIPIGKWFKENTSPDSKILINDVGAVGYYSERFIIDAAALINRDLELNKKIMQTPVDERGRVSNLLKFVNADYIVERDSTSENLYSGNPEFKLLVQKTFPGLGISDPSPRYFKVYKVNLFPF